MWYGTRHLGFPWVLPYCSLLAARNTSHSLRCVSPFCAVMLAPYLRELMECSMYPLNTDSAAALSCLSFISSLWSQCSNRRPITEQYHSQKTNIVCMYPSTHIQYICILYVDLHIASTHFYHMCTHKFTYA